MIPSNVYIYIYIYVIIYAHIYLIYLYYAYVEVVIVEVVAAELCPHRPPVSQTSVNDISSKTALVTTI